MPRSNWEKGYSSVQFVRRLLVANNFIRTIILILYPTGVWGKKQVFVVQKHSSDRRVLLGVSSLQSDFFPFTFAKNDKRWGETSGQIWRSLDFTEILGSSLSF